MSWFSDTLTPMNHDDGTVYNFDELGLKPGVDYIACNFPDEPEEGYVPDDVPSIDINDL